MTAAALAVAGVALYAMAGFWIAPLVLERKLQAMVREETDLDLAIGAVTVNPFTLALSLDNVTLFRPENPPVVSFERVEARMQGIDFGKESLRLRDVAIRSLEVADDPGQPPALTAQSLTADTFVLAPELASTSFDDLRVEQPLIQLRRDPEGELDLPHTLGFLITAPSANVDIGVTLVVSGGMVAFTDHSLRALHRLEVEGIDGSITRRRAAGGITANASLHGRMSGGGTADLTAEWLPDRPREKTRFDLKVHRLALPRVSPYVAAMFDRKVVAGRVDLAMELSIDESMLDMDTGIVVEHLELEQKDEDAAGQSSRLETAIALLEDANGRISFDVPVTGRPDGYADVATALSGALADYLRSLTAAPFEYLAGLAGRPDMNLGQLEFSPGSAEIRGDTSAKVSALSRALQLRPKLAFTVFPGLDEAADRKALARQQILLHVNLASSAGLPGQPAPESLDFDDPIVQSVLDEFVDRRLPPSQREALVERNPGRDTSYYRRVFAALVDNEVVALPALVRLARYRARSVVERLASSDDGGNRVREAKEIVLAAPGRSTGVEVILEVHPAKQ
jgi:Domain of Unknown Function (DUF748)